MAAKKVPDFVLCLILKLPIVALQLIRVRHLQLFFDYPITNAQFLTLNMLLLDEKKTNCPLKQKKFLLFFSFDCKIFTAFAYFLPCFILTLFEKNVLRKTNLYRTSSHAQPWTIGEQIAQQQTHCFECCLKRFKKSSAKRTGRFRTVSHNAKNFKFTSGLKCKNILGWCFTDYFSKSVAFL